MIGATALLRLALLQLAALSICTTALQAPSCSRRGVRRKAGEDDSVPQPDPIYSDEAVVALCMNALGRNDDPIPDAGLRTCWNFSAVRRYSRGAFESDRLHAVDATWSLVASHTGTAFLCRTCPGISCPRAGRSGTTKRIRSSCPSSWDRRRRSTIRHGSTARFLHITQWPTVCA